MAPSLDPCRLADDARDDPPLAAAQRPALDDEDLVAFLRALLVVRDELGRAALRLAVQLVPDHALDGHDDRLGHLVAHHGSELLCFAHCSIPATPASRAAMSSPARDRGGRRAP